MDEQERDRALARTLLVHIVNVKRAKPVHRNVTRELWQLVDLVLGLAPVESVFPMFDEPLDVSERDTVVPAGIVELVRVPGEVKLLLEELEIGVGNAQLERSFWTSRHSEDVGRSWWMVGGGESPELCDRLNRDV